MRMPGECRASWCSEEDRALLEKLTCSNQVFIAQNPSEALLTSAEIRIARKELSTIVELALQSSRKREREKRLERKARAVGV